MVLVVLSALALMGVIASWEKQLPTPGETFAELSPKRRALSIAAIPVSVCVVVGFVLVAVGVAGAQNQPGYSNESLVALAGAAALGFSYLFAVAVSRVSRARKPGSAPKG